MPTTLNNATHVLLVNLNSSIPDNITSFLGRSECKVTQVSGLEAVGNAELLDSIDAVLISLGASMDSSERKTLLRQMEVLETRCIGTMVMDPDEDPFLTRAGSLVATVGNRISPDELWGRLATITQYSGVLRRLERELSNMQRLGRKLNQHFVELDHEMQLASRLQRDFLPDKLPEIGNARFHVLFRPAQWVSGDTYDVFRLDEEHVGFYVVDAVGHGVAAGLLTMFIKKALPTKLVEGDSYMLLTPSQSMRALNQALCRQNLPNSQFVTACLCVLNTRTLELTVSRGGHPYPVHVSADGQLSAIKSEGGLLGLFPKEDFPQTTTSLQPGEKVILFSDGVELAFVKEPDDTTCMYRYQMEFQELAKLSAEHMIREFTRRLDDAEGSLNPRDDITVVIMEILKS